MAADTGIIDFNEEASRAVEALYTTQDVVEQRRAVVEAVSPRPGERVLDIGSGPGLLAVELAEAVGPGGAVEGIDVSPSMNELARRRPPRERSAPLNFREAEATALPFGDASFDAVVSTQVYEYVEDMATALAEARRVLAPGGRLVVLDTDWDSVVWRSSDDDRMRRVLDAWDDHLVHRDLPRRLPQLIRESGLAMTRCDVFPVLNVGYRRETYSGGTLEFISAYVMTRGIAVEESVAWADDLRGLGEDYFFSVNRYLFTAER